MIDPRKPPAPEDLVRALFSALAKRAETGGAATARRDAGIGRTPIAPATGAETQSSREGSSMLVKIIIAVIIAAAAYVLEGAHVAVPVAIIAFAIAFVIYYGVRRDGLSASWPSFTRQGVLAC